jgi:hypothetical protein
MLWDMVIEPTDGKMICLMNLFDGKLHLVHTTIKLVTTEGDKSDVLFKTINVIFTAAQTLLDTEKGESGFF